MSTEIYRIDGPWSGTLSISSRPRGGDWLEDEVKNWRDAGFDIIVSLLIPQEEQEMDLTLEGEYARQQHMKFASFPIVDRSVPESRTSILKLIEQLEADLMEGKKINIHCRQGIGRSSLIAVSLLIARGVPTAEALERVSAARHSPVTETQRQRDWIDSVALSLAPIAHSNKS